MKKKLTFLLVIVLLITLFTGCGQSTDVEDGEGEEISEKPGEATYTIVAGHGGAENTALHGGFVLFKELIEERSDGDIQVDVFPNQQLGGDREITEAVQGGDVTMCAPSTAPLAAFAPKFYVLDIPYLFTERDTTYKVLDGEAGEMLLDSLSEHGLIGLGFWENGFRNVTNNKGPVTKPEDIENQKVRTMENEIHLDAWKSLGANPTPMAFGELYTALQQKTMDAQENPIELIYATKFYEVQKYISKTGHVYSAYVPFINKDFFESLPEEYQTLIVDTMKEVTVKQRELALANEEEYEGIMKETNEVNELTLEEKEVFKEKMSSSIGLARKNAGDEIVDIFFEAADY